MRLRRIVLVLATGMVLWLGSARAEGHGMGPIAVLQTTNVYVPQWAIGGAYGISPTVERNLEAAANDPSAGHPVKVLLIAQPYDMGGDGPEQLFNSPDAYAGFIAGAMRELHIFAGSVIVAMPKGIGVWSSDKRAATEARSVRVHMRSRWDINGLATPTIRAVRAFGSERRSSKLGYPVIYLTEMACVVLLTTSLGALLVKRGAGARAGGLKHRREP